MSEMDAAEYNAQAGKGSKFRNQFVEEDGITFRSKAEHRRYQVLKLRIAAGEIADLEIQPRYPLIVNGLKITTYVADYRYRDLRTGELVVEDVKGAVTLLYTMKRKLMKAIHGIDVQEVAA